MSQSPITDVITDYTVNTVATQIPETARQTATSGSIGAMVAAARLLQLDVEQTRYAIGLAATRTAGLK